MCRSIPIVSNVEHSGRNDVERSIGYRFYLVDDEPIYDDEIVENNFRLFIRHQTVIRRRERP